MSVLDFLKRRVMVRNPVKYYRKLGVTIGNEASTHPSVNFGSESYLIKLGSHVR